MGEWTNLNIQDGVEFRTNVFKTEVTISTIHGEYTASVSELREKLLNNNLLPDVRKMFKAMLDYAEKS